MIVYDLETFNTDRCVPYSVGLYKLSKIWVKYYRDITDPVIEKCKICCGVSNGTTCINEMLDHFSFFKVESRKVTIKFLECNLYYVAHRGSGFDTYLVFEHYSSLADCC